jgi:uncharacterized protein YggU (UPF0235/DUF167 family)
MRVGDPTRAQRGEADGELSNRIRQEVRIVQRNPLVGQANREISTVLARHGQAWPDVCIGTKHAYIR